MKHNPGMYKSKQNCNRLKVVSGINHSKQLVDHLAKLGKKIGKPKKKTPQFVSANRCKPNCTGYSKLWVVKNIKYNASFCLVLMGYNDVNSIKRLA